LLDRSARQRIRSAVDLVAEVSSIDPEIGAALAERAREFTPDLLVNQTSAPEDVALGGKISAACRDYLGCDLADLGSLPHDSHVGDALRRGESVLRLHPGCSFALGIEALAQRLLGCEPAAQQTRGRAWSYRLSPSLYDERHFHTHGERSAPTKDVSVPAVSEPTASPPPTVPQAEAHLRAPQSEARRSSAPKPAAPTRPAPWTQRGRTSGGTGRPMGLPPALALPGAYLRQCRERLGLSLTEARVRTQIRSLEHLEAERYEMLPPELYVRAFVTQYAELLGIENGAALAQRFIDRYRIAQSPTSAC
jgi:hypothetical protein